MRTSIVWLRCLALLLLATCGGAFAQSITPTIDLSGLPSSTVPGRNLIVTATVSGSSGTATGSVDILVRNLGTNGIVGGCGNLNLDSSGSASCFFTTPPNGSYQVEVAYSGNYAATTTAFPFTTQQATVTITLSGLLSTVPGRNLTITSNVSSASPLGTPTGSVDFVRHDLSSNGRTGLCGNINVDASGNSSCFFTTPANGNYEIEVNYSGDAPNAPGTQAFPFTTQQATVSITLSGLPSTTTPVTSMTLTSNVSSASPLGTPTGSVDFVRHDLSSNGRTGLCGNINVDPSGNSSCFFTTPSALGSYEIEVNYSGDAPNAAATQAFPFTVSNAPVVTNTNDSGPGSLRDAITYVNANCASQAITFNLPIEPVGPKTIHLLSALPPLTCGGSAIDGYSQPGASRNTLAQGNNAVIMIELDGSGAGAADGLVIAGQGPYVAGIAIGNFLNGAGISVTAPIGNSGVELSGVFIGTDATGTVARPNGIGVHTNPSSTGLGICGDHAEGGRNLVSGNLSDGIRLESGSGTVICNTYIGTNASGTAALANGGIGIELTGGASGTMILGNVISGNGSDGIYIGAALTGEVITGNFIGVGPDGTTSLGNANMGVTINGSNGVTIGGDPVSAGNVIANNHFDGVVVVSGTNNAIQGNSIYGNGRLGIGLNPSGTVPANDACDGDGGSNGLANWPVLASAGPIGDGIRVVGNLNSTPGTTFRVEFFSTPSGIAADHRAGRTFIGYGNYTTDGSCNAPIDVSLFVPVAIGDLVTATATDPSGNTSVFSNAVAVAAAAAPPTITAIRPSIGGMAGGSAVVIEGTNLDTLTSVTFGGNPAAINIPGQTSITVTAPPSATVGGVDVVVTNAGGSATAPGGFAYASDDSAARDFSVALNPSSRWTYGYELTRGGAFTPYGAHYNDAGGNSGIDIWASSPGSLPSIWHNGTATAQGRAGSNSTPAGGLGLHPGGSDEKSVVRWTAPSSGTYSISGSFMGLDFGYPTTTDWAVLRNNDGATPLFTGAIANYAIPYTFSTNVALNAGETIEFVVGFGGNGYFGDATGLDATITRIGSGPNSLVSLSPTSITFGAELVGVFSPTQRVTLTNTGTDPLTITSVSGSSSFSVQGNTCVSPLAASASCFVDVSFVPATYGALSGTLTFTTDARTSPDVVTLSGMGMLPPVMSIVASAPIVVGGLSTIGVGIANPGQNPLAYSAFSVTLDYPAGFTTDASQPEASSCGATVSRTSTSISGSGGSVSSGVGCTVVIQQIIAPSTPGTYTFTIPAGGFAVSSPVAYSNPSPMTLTVTVSATAPPAALSLSPASVAFGSQAVNTTSATQAVTLTNTGGTAMSIASIAVGSGFTKSNGSPACGTTLVAGASCVVNVAFAPTAATTYSANLTIVDSASGSPHQVPLSGTGVAAPAVSLTPTSLTFASRTVSTMSPAQTVTLANMGNGPLSISSITISGDYAFTSACGASVPAGGSCTIDVTFTPLVAGARSGALTITDNASGSPHTVPLSGTGLSGAAAVANVSPGALDFPPQPVGSESAPEIVTVANTGSAPLTFSSIGITGEFAIVTPAGPTPPACPVTLAPGESCRIAVIFRPAGTNLRQGKLTIATNGGTSTITVLGTGMIPEPPQLTVPSSVDFGSQPVGTKSSGHAVALHNVSPYVATITELSTSGDFAVSDTCTTIAAGATCSPLVTFQPTDTGTRTGSLTIRSLRDIDPYHVALTGIGEENLLPVLEVSPTRIGFGNAFVGSASTVHVTLTNSGRAPLAIESILATGSFLVGNTCAVIPAGSSCIINVTFVPGRRGGQAGTIEIRSNAADSPHRIDLQGTGCLVPSPSVARLGVLLCGP